jgi:hypothetical protein
MTAADSAAVVADLRRARRRQRVASIHWIDAMYQVYITGLVAIVAVVLLSGVVGDDEVAGSTLADVRTHGPAVVGVLAALAVLLGLRSGSRGGPLALEQPDVRHVLLSPVDRGVALRGPAWRQLRFLAFASAAVGATAGQLALRRLPGNGAEWMLAGAAFAVVVAGLGFGSALLAAGTKLPQWAATLVGSTLVAWSVADVFGRAPSAPGSVAGRLALWPLHGDALSLLGVAVALALVVAGMRLVSGTSLEGAERRTALVGQLRFAVTLQDLRTVLVLRRQLAQERPRSRPWIPALGRRTRFPVWARGVRSVLRWPASRFLRVVILAAVSGMAMRGVWSGTTPLVVLAGLALWVAALDAVEPLGQEIDHPGRTDSYPFERGELFLKHLPIVGVVTVAAGLVAGLVALAPVGDDPVPAGVALLVGATAGLLAGCGAVVSVIQGAPDAVDVLAMSTPEIAGSRTVIRTAWPPGLSIIGTLPLLAARASVRGVQDPPPIGAALSTMAPLISIAVLVGGWVRFHDAIHEWIRNALEQASPTKALERAAEQRAELEASRPGPLEPVGLDGEDDDDGAAPAKAPAPKPKPKPQPKIDAPPGFRGGSSPKPMGRRRDQS